MPTPGSVLRLQPTRNAPSLARQAVRDCGARWPAATLYATLTVVSELVTNAFVHGEGVITVAVERGSDAVAVAVADDGPHHPTMLDSTPDAERGRGLVVVNNLASAWGVRPAADGPGKTVWARVSAAPPGGHDLT